MGGVRGRKENGEINYNFKWEKVCQKIATLRFVILVKKKTMKMLSFILLGTYYNA